MTRTTGLHHITAICSDPLENMRFYTQVLNLRFIKKTVNQDDPSAYHLYYSDNAGTPGTLVTFFAWTTMPKGEAGSGEVTAITFAVEDLNDWKEHLQEKAVVFEELDETLVFNDPDGIVIRIVESEMPGREPMGRPAMLGVQGVELSVRDVTLSAPLLVAMGFEGSDLRFTHEDSGTFVELKELDLKAKQGAGSVHHVAFGVETDDQEQLRTELIRKGFDPTPIIERFYFRSVYFQEANGALFEIASNGPGFFIDEEVPGSSLVLPPWFEAYRERIERALPNL